MSTDTQGAAQGPPTSRAGFVLIAGLPNAGKSTLLNALVGERLSIVTPKPQTTWQRVLGIRTEDSFQMIFLDTPGIMTGSTLFHRSILADARQARQDADVALCVVDGAAIPSPEELRILSDYVDEIRAPKLLVINKIDDRRFAPHVVEHLEKALGAPSLLVSAKKGLGVDSMLDFLRAHLPEGPFLYPEDDLASAPVRFFVGELIRETLFERYHQEIPYAAVVTIDEFREAEDPVYIGATIHVERRSQKGMIIGKRGAAIRTLGASSREKIEHFIDARVYLDLWVTVSDGWRRKKEGLTKFGFTIPDDAD